MGKINLKGKPTTRIIDGETEDVIIFDNESLDAFNPRILGLGNMSSPSKQVEALAAVFDLSGFTNFCSQVDPHLAVPEFLSRFLDWLFGEIKGKLTAKDYAANKALLAELPFFAKFLGDGVLFLWNTSNMSERRICNTVTSLEAICHEYATKFYPEIKKIVVNPPSALRCGVARGGVFSVGNKQDYVGPCINIASRLQKVSYLTFCFPRRGFDVEKYMHPSMVAEFMIKSFNIRGIGENELIWLLKREFDVLPESEKELFLDP